MKIMRLLFFRNSACFDGPEYRCNVYTLLLIIVLTCLITESYATTFTCEAPKKGGKFTISLKSLNAKCEGIVVQIPNGSTAAQKATLIANWINASCAGVFTASATNGEVTVSNGANPGMRVFLKFGQRFTNCRLITMEPLPTIRNGERLTCNSLVLRTSCILILPLIRPE